jgi:hypothetical protein
MGLDVVVSPHHAHSAWSRLTNEKRKVKQHQHTKPIHHIPTFDFPPSEQTREAHTFSRDTLPPPLPLHPSIQLAPPSSKYRRSYHADRSSRPDRRRRQSRAFDPSIPIAHAKRRRERHLRPTVDCQARLIPPTHQPSLLGPSFQLRMTWIQKQKSGVVVSVP